MRFSREMLVSSMELCHRGRRLVDRLTETGPVTVQEANLLGCSLEDALTALGSLSEFNEDISARLRLWIAEVMKRGRPIKRQEKEMLAALLCGDLQHFHIDKMLGTWRFIKFEERMCHTTRAFAWLADAFRTHCPSLGPLISFEGDCLAMAAMHMARARVGRTPPYKRVFMSRSQLTGLRHQEVRWQYQRLADWFADPED